MCTHIKDKLIVLLNVEKNNDNYNCGWERQLIDWKALITLLFSDHDDNIVDKEEEDITQHNVNNMWRLLA